MLIELNITAIGDKMKWNDQLEEVLRLVEKLGLPYQLTPMGTRVEGRSDDIMSLVIQSYDRLYKALPHILSTVRIEHDGDLAPEVQAMDQSRFDTYAVLLRGYAAELQETAEYCLEQANHLGAATDPAGLTEPEPGSEDARMSVVLSRISGKIDRVMLAYDMLQEAVGGIARYAPALEQLKARPAEGASAPAASD
jgi:uncharacterized protein YqgV (UPF0045/DUF77 family)